MKILQYCSVCKTEFEMEVVPTADGDDDGVVWLQCPSCRGFLPKIRSSLDIPSGPPADATDEADAPARSDPVPEPDLDAGADLDIPGDVAIGEDETGAGDAPSPDREAEPEAGSDTEGVEPPRDLDRDQAVVYRPWNAYSVGDVIKHLAWDDYGVVLAKETIPGNRRVLKVSFENAGVVRLIEQDGSRS